MFSARLRQGYGLTEVGSVCSVNTNWVYKDGSIGKPLEGVRMEIWDDDRHPLPDGEGGEIVIAGPTIMEGYLTENGPKDEGLYYDDEGTAWVLSGDLGYRDEDGFFYFSGRKKRLIIISGYNVYPGQLEPFRAMTKTARCLYVSMFRSRKRAMRRLTARR